MTRMEQVTHSLAEFEAEASRFARDISPRYGRATLVTLSGELGAGKTAFVKAVARAFGITENVPSPTFVLMKSYAIPEASPRAGDASPTFHRLIHIDAYRLESGRELDALDFDEALKQAENLVMLEWPENVAFNARVSDEHSAGRDVSADISVSIEVLSDGIRRILYG